MLTRLDGLLRKYHALATWFLILIMVVFYHGVLTCGFVFDDLALILLTPYIRNPHLWRQLFFGPLLSFAGPAIPGSFYRPLGMFCFWLVCRVAGLAPAGRRSQHEDMAGPEEGARERIGRRPFFLDKGVPHDGS